MLPVLFFNSLSDLGVADLGQLSCAFPSQALAWACHVQTCIFMPDACYCWRANATSRVTPSVGSTTHKVPREPPEGVAYSAIHPNGQCRATPHACWCSCWASYLDSTLIQSEYLLLSLDFLDGSEPLACSMATCVSYSHINISFAIFSLDTCLFLIDM